jgi:hypothetical protein
VNGDNPCPINPLATHEVYVEGNIARISIMIPIDISKTLDIVENFFIGLDCSPEDIQTYIELFKDFYDVFAFSYEEIPGIDPRIVEHEIMSYPDAKPIRQKLHLVNPQKVAAIKEEVEKLLKASFIYPVHLTEWVSNPVPVNKK